MDPPGENTRRKSIEDCCTTTALQHNTEPTTWREDPEDREGGGRMRGESAAGSPI